MVAASVKKPLLILGTRTLAEEVFDLVTETDEYEVTGFVENMDRSLCDKPIEGLPVHWVDDIAPLAATHVAVCALGTTKRSRFTEEVARLGFRFGTVIHPSARISRRTTVGEGSIVSAGVIVATRTTIAEHVFINRGALIGHHTTIGSHCSIMPGANIAGSCTIGRRCYIGMGSIIIDHLSIGEGSIVGAGSVVTRDVPPSVQVVGVPARIIRENVDGR